MGDPGTADPSRQAEPTRRAPAEGQHAGSPEYAVVPEPQWLPMGYVAHDLLPKSTVYDSFVQWRDDGTWAKLVEVLRKRTRVAAGREPTPSAACMDSQSVKTTEMGGPERGYDGGKKINGRKRHLLVDTLGLLLAVLITSAALMMGWRHRSCSGTSTPTIFRVSSRFLRIRSITITLWRPGWLSIVPGWRIEVKARPAGTKGFTPLEKRWVIEQTTPGIVRVEKTVRTMSTL